MKTLPLIAMIPVRMGSQRLKQKNLREVGGLPLITQAIRKCREADVFDDVWVNSEHPAFGEVAAKEGVRFHRRPEELGNNQATSEQYISEFLRAHTCSFIVQVHSIAPLLTPDHIRDFVGELRTDRHDVLLSVVDEQIECMMGGNPVNFTFSEKTNSQELTPIRRVVWAITGWRRATYLQAVQLGNCATYSGRVGTFSIDRAAGHIIKTEEDLKLAEALWQSRSSNSVD